MISQKQGGGRSVFFELKQSFREIPSQKIIVTAAFGGIDHPMIPKWYFEAGFLVVLITDQDIQVHGCKTIRVNVPDHTMARFLAKLPKILLPRLAPNAELAIWVDANIILTEHFFKIISREDFEMKALTVFEHAKSRSPFAEGVHCILLGKDAASSIFGAFYDYVKYGNLLTLFRARINACGILVWRPKLGGAKRISMLWFWLLMRGSIRDQISFPLALQLAKEEVSSFRMPYTYDGVDAPLQLRPHEFNNFPKLSSSQGFLVNIASMIYRVKKMCRRKSNGLNS